MSITNLKKSANEPGLEEMSALQHARAQVDPEVLNFDHLGRYTNGDEVLEHELLGLFKIQAVLQFENIDIAASKPDWVMAVHTLKGCALSVGAARVGALTGELETLGFEGDDAEKQDKFRQLKYAIAKCVVTIDELDQLA